MRHLRVLVVVVLVAIAGFLYVPLTQYVLQTGTSLVGLQPLTRVLTVDVVVKSNEEFPTFLAKNSGFLAVHTDPASTEHTGDRLETRYILDSVAKTHKSTINRGDELYATLEILFLRKNSTGIHASYLSLSDLHVRSIVFNSAYLAQFFALYQDPLPHAVGYIVMSDGSQRSIRDILAR